MMPNAISSQKKHYESIHDAYESHYYDTQSMVYRERFYYAPLFDGLNLNDCTVADVAAGSGHNSLALLKRFPTAEITGFEISAPACEAFRRNVGRPCIEADLTRPLVHPGTFDAVMIVGGLHHCTSDLSMVFRNLADLLKAGGRMLMVEPNREFMLEGLRRLWYRADRYFDDANEKALAHAEILAQAGAYFASERLAYCGGPGYFLISQSLLFRLSKPIKRAISPPLMVLESLFNVAPVRWMHPYFVARWVRTGTRVSPGQGA